MSMSMGSSKGYSSDINVTPMIDVLLVLLIIFMVIVPMMPRGLDAVVPRAPKANIDPSPERTIVVQAFNHPGSAPTYKINDSDVAKSDLLSKLTQIYANRAERVMFVKGDDGLSFSYVAEMIDIGRAANVDHIGLMTPKSQTSM